MRKGFPGLSLLVQETLRQDPCGGHLFVFRGRRGDLIKIIWHDGQGASLFMKRLERGRFIWPTSTGGAVHLTPAQLHYLLEGIDWRAPQKTWRPEIAERGAARVAAWKRAHPRHERGRRCQIWLCANALS